ncbi:hypothetical protein [Scleromatobacter humisilvae]|uniref:Uncharacterized protein n=1 Tax=Scleromatobacter humisilvae TaxID=2897159 RepID=A0A9X2C2W1_9BURK|nr:hypothetical protein [Scleromatobacter humisilvae]MCK9687259.1 hypothetical protein [Scleromatobacter humisilvae]
MTDLDISPEEGRRQQDLIAAEEAEAKRLQAAGVEVTVLLESKDNEVLAVWLRSGVPPRDFEARPPGEASGKS